MMNKYLGQVCWGAMAASGPLTRAGSPPSPVSLPLSYSRILTATVSRSGRPCSNKPFMCVFVVSRDTSSHPCPGPLPGMPTTPTPQSTPTEALPAISLFSSPSPARRRRAPRGRDCGTNVEGCACVRLDLGTQREAGHCPWPRRAHRLVVYS